MNKNKFIVIALMLICFFGLKSNVFADNFMTYEINDKSYMLLDNPSANMADEDQFDSVNFCKDISSGIKIAGYTIIIIKIITPLAIILMGSFDFYKAVTSGKPDDLKKQAIMLGNRVLVGLIIFFLPTILKTALNFISGESEYISCIDCLFDPNNSCK